MGERSVRGCLTQLLLASLLAANGYAIWQVHCLRTEVAALRQGPSVERTTGSQSLADTARSALEAVKRGEVTEARDELDRLAGQLASMRELTSQRRSVLQAQIRAAQQAVASRSGEAASRVEDIVRELSHKVRKEAQGDDPAGAEP